MKYISPSKHYATGIMAKYSNKILTAGTCWAFAYCSTAESSLIAQGYENIS